jgi:hypothetical protein
MLHVVVIFVDCSETEFLNLPPSTLRQVVEAAVCSDVAAQDGGDGIITACSKSQMTVVGSTL